MPTRYVCEFRIHNGRDWLADNATIEAASPEAAQLELQRLNPTHSFLFVGSSLNGGACDTGINHPNCSCAYCRERTFCARHGWHHGIWDCPLCDAEVSCARS